LGGGFEGGGWFRFCYCDLTPLLSESITPLFTVKYSTVTKVTKINVVWRIMKIWYIGEEFLRFQKSESE
jgi:hypothetical protein